MLGAAHPWEPGAILVVRSLPSIHPAFFGRQGMHADESKAIPEILFLTSGSSSAGVGAGYRCAAVVSCRGLA